VVLSSSRTKYQHFVHQHLTLRYCRNYYTYPSRNLISQHNTMYQPTQPQERATATTKSSQETLSTCLLCGTMSPTESHIQSHFQDSVNQSKALCNTDLDATRLVNFLLSLYPGRAAARTAYRASALRQWRLKDGSDA